MTYYADPLVTLLHGDCIEVMAGLDADSVDSVVTDPPYGLEFMGKSWDRLGDVGTTSHSGPSPTAGGERGQYGKISYGGSANRKCRTCGKWAWDYPERKCVCETPDFPSVVNHQSKLMQAWHEQWATEAFRVLKPGGYLLAFGGSRTFHRLASAIEDAGFEIRDTLMWVTASGFPKSRNVSADLLAAVPVDARCACAPHSSRTAPSSQDGYRPERGSDDAPPHPVEGSGLTAAPSPAGARGRSRGGRRKDGPAAGPEHTLGLASTDRLPTEDSPALASLPGGDSRASDSAPSGTPSSTSSDGSTAGHRTPARTLDTPDSAAASSDPASAWSPPNGDRFPYSKCTTCGGWQTAEGWGSAMKPAMEPITMARKPLVGNLAANVTRYGVGAINIDGSRIGTDGGHEGAGPGPSQGILGEGLNGVRAQPVPGLGRWPSNVLLSDPALFDEPNPAIIGSGSAEEGGAGYSRFFAIPQRGNVERFWSKVNKSDGCWEWTGSTDVKGYGRLWGDEQNRSLKAHRVSWELANGPIPDGMQVLHHCDNPPCVNPAHLFLGTHDDNMADMVSKGRTGWGDVKGEERYNAQLTEEIVREARALHSQGWTYAQLEERYGVHQRVISKAVRGISWKHVTDDPEHPIALIIPKAPRAERMVNGQRGTHPTQKPVDLLRHLLRLVTPPGGVALDPFAGSGTTGVAASLEGIRSILIEREAEYAEQAKGRLMATPMGLGLDVPAPTRFAGRPESQIPPIKFDRSSSTAVFEGYTEKPDEEPAA